MVAGPLPQRRWGHFLVCSRALACAHAGARRRCLLGRSAPAAVAFSSVVVLLGQVLLGASLGVGSSSRSCARRRGPARSGAASPPPLLHHLPGPLLAAGSGAGLPLRHPPVVGLVRGTAGLSSVAAQIWRVPVDGLTVPGLVHVSVFGRSGVRPFAGQRGAGRRFVCCRRCAGPSWPAVVLSALVCSCLPPPRPSIGRRFSAVAGVP